MTAVNPGRMPVVTGGSGIPVTDMDNEQGISGWVLNLKAFGYNRDEALHEALRYFYSYSPDIIRHAVNKAYGM